MKEEQRLRLAELLSQGKKLAEMIVTLPYLASSSSNTQWRPGSPEYKAHKQRENAHRSIKDKIEAQAKPWFYSSAKTICDVVSKGSFYWEECEKLRAQFSDPRLLFSYGVYLSMNDLLVSIHSELERGLLNDPEYLFASETFSDFLDHAAMFLSQNRIREASVLGSAVLEDTMKKLAKKCAVESTKEKGLEDLINALLAKGVFKSVQANKLKACAGIRKHAFHAEWESISVADVQLLITETKDLLRNCF